MLYKNCRELPYHNFNEVQIANDLTYLIKDKEVHDQKELEIHWIEILDEYFKISKDFTQSKFFRDRAHLLSLKLKLDTLQKLQVISELPINEHQKKQIDEICKIYRVDNLEQAILGTTDDINLKINQLSKLKNNKKNSNFEEALAAMRMNGYQVNRHEITVSEFVIMLDQMKKQKPRGRKR